MNMRAQSGQIAHAVRRMLSNSMQRQLVARLIAVFVLVALGAMLFASQGYQWLINKERVQRADDAQAHLLQRYEAMYEEWQRNAVEVKAHIDFMRVFAGADINQGWLKLRAYFAALEGRFDHFPSGVVMGTDERVLFRYGPDGGLLKEHIERNREVPAWLLLREHNSAYAVMSVPLWLGQQGTGRLVLLRPIENAHLRGLSSSRMRLYLVERGRVLSSSEGDRDLGREIAIGTDGMHQEQGRAFIQRSLVVFARQGASDEPPVLMMRLDVEDIFSVEWVVAGSLLLLATLSGMIWLVVGRWISRQARRVAALSAAAARFADEHAMSAALTENLRQAQSGADEIGDVARTNQQLMESVLRFDQEQFVYLQTLDILEEGVVELDASGRFLRASAGWARLAGEDASIGRSLFDFIDPEDADTLRQQLAPLLSGAKTGLSGRARLRRSDKKEFWVEYRFVRAGETGDNVHLRGVLRDITQSYQLEKHVTHMALHDALTNLPNRVLMEDRCKIALRTAERSGHKVALGFLDLDHFKHVNDQFGHRVGDELLVSLSTALRRCLRSGDTLARWGGDEFVVLLTEISSIEDARDAMSKLTGVCHAPVHIEGNEFNPTFSMGVAIFPDDAQTTEALLSQADRAMFSAKDQGRNAVQFFSDIAFRDQDRQTVYLQNRLVAAIRERQIQTWFQPIVDARTHKVVSCEALARWHDDKHGWVPPTTFIPMAENLGLIRELGQQVWAQAIDNLHRWREQGMDMRISVNVSRRQLFTPRFVADLLEDLDRQAIPVSVVDLEITESVAMEDAEHTEKRLCELTEAGFGIAIDDFGTGYSSLSQLHDMPASKIKIDISFVSRAHGEQGLRLIEAIVKIAAAFRLQTVAEGVEDAATAETLASVGVNLLQGYAFGRPMNGADFERYLLTNFSRPVYGPQEIGT